VAAEGRVRVLIADDHQAVLERMAAMLAGEFSVVATVSDGVQLVAAEAALQPDVLVVDISMPEMNGLEAAVRIRGRGSRVPIVCVTTCGPEMLDAALDAGAIGYVSKASMVADLIPAIRAALNGENFFSPPFRPPT
jgi:DNA-binding NarL/FixJ family response regulator